MSTKIYNGYKVKIKPDQFISFSKKLQQEVKDRFYKEFSIMRASNLSRLLDCIFLSEIGEDINGTELFRYSNSDFFKKTLDLENRDWHTSWVFFDAIDDYPLMLFYGREDIEKILKDVPEIIPYFYFDNSDKPEEISDDEWYKRDSDWDVVLGGNGLATPATCGLSFNVYANWDIPDGDSSIEGFIKYQSDKERRIHFIFREIRNVYYNRKFPDKTVKNPVSKYLNWLDSQEQKDLYDEIREKLQIILPSSYNESDVVKKYNTNELDNINFDFITDKILTKV